jgi:acyl dehydratase
MAENNLFFEDVAGGDEIPSLTNRATLVQMAMYAAATWDFHRHHYDKQFAQSKGYPAPFVDGQMFGGLLTRMLISWTGPNVVLKKLNLTYRMMVFPGDCIICMGKVVKKYTEEGENLIRCDLWVENENREKVVAPAHALLALPSKSINLNRVSS